MKKFLLMAAIVAALCAVCASCSDDDDNKGSVSAPEISNFGGYRLMSLGDSYGSASFSYNSDGSLRQISDEGYESNLVFDYAKGIITYYKEDFRQEVPFTTNSKGYITAFNGCINYEDGEKYEYYYKFEYNGADHLSRIVFHDDSVTEDGKREEDNVTWNFFWDGNLLSKVEIKGESIYGEEHEKWTTTLTFTYEGAPENRYMQFTYGLVEDIDIDSDISSPIYAGLFGKASSKYPTKTSLVRIGDDEDGPYTDQEEYKYGYVLNSFGLVESEISKGYDDYITEYVYSNSSAKTVSKSAKTTASTNNKSKISKRRHGKSHHHVGLFRR